MKNRQSIVIFGRKNLPCSLEFKRAVTAARNHFFNNNSLEPNGKKMCKNCRWSSSISSTFSLVELNNNNNVTFSGGCCVSTVANDKDVELTSIRYKEQIVRGKYASLSKEDVQNFRTTLGNDCVIISEASEIHNYNVDWLRTVRGCSQLVMKPQSTEQVSEILKYCNTKKLAVVPQGGNTGLVGGSVPVFDEIVISMSSMNKIISVDEWSGVVVVEAGCVLETLQENLLKHDLFMPLDLGAKKKCQIGGNVSTNAGGLRFVRYGSLHSNVLGLEVVLPDGTILNCLNKHKKDNSGYDLKHLFIGSEGTLGIVTKVAIQCPAKPNSVNLALFGLDKFECVLKLSKIAKKNLSEILSSCEYIDNTCMNCVEKNLGLKSPIGEHKFYMLIETSGSNGKHDMEKLDAFLDTIQKEEISMAGIVAKNDKEFMDTWSLREGVGEALRREGHSYQYDVSIPLQTFDTLVQDLRSHLGTSVKKVCGFGHFGDGNIHIHAIADKFDKEVLNQIEPYIFAWVHQHEGSISAEHGLGFLKRNYIGYSKSPVAIDLMKTLKNNLDPNNILNPYKVLPDAN